MQQTIRQRGTISSGNTTQYWHPFSGNAGTSTVLNRVEATLPVAGTFRDLRVEAATALTGAQQLVVALLVNGSPTGLTVTLNSGAQTATDTTNDVAASAGDTIAWRIVGTNSPTVTGIRVSFGFEATAAHTSIGGYGGVTAGTLLTTGYNGPLYGSGAWLAANSGYNLIATPGTITEHRVRLSASPGSGNSRTFVFIKNGVDQDGTGGTTDTRITISDAATTGSASFSLAVVAGDDVQVKETISGTPTNAYGIGSVAFVSTLPNRWNVGDTVQSNPSTSATNYQYDGGPNDSYSATESARELLNGPNSFWLSGFRWKGIAPGIAASGRQWDWTLRKNGASTGQTINIFEIETTGSDFGETVEIADGDETSMMVVPANTPITPVDARWAFVASTTDPGPGEGGSTPDYVPVHLLNAGLNTGFNAGFN